MKALISGFNWRSPWLWLPTLLALAVLRGLWVDVMDVDASQYASISMEMLRDGSWLQVHHQQADYLDKPPLLFWTSALMYSLFGVHNWTYKLPSVLAAIAGVYGVFRFTKLYYSSETARNAAAILASSLGLIVICNDVRTDTLLLGASACAVWQLAEYLRNERLKYLIGAFTCIGLAMLAKGPIGLVLPGFAVGAHLLLQRDWRKIFKWQWLLGLLVSMVVIAPMLWGLYQQFDLHPEKSINGRSGVSGLYFFFWEQSFGRITGENVWKNDTSPFYFLHVYLWAFLPWALTFYLIFAKKIKAIVQSQFKIEADAEGYSVGAFAFTFVALSLSHYKLPHYIFITLPWAAVLTAAGLESSRNLKWPGLLVYLSGFVALAFAFSVSLFIFSGQGRWATLLLLLPSFWLIRALIRQFFPTTSGALVLRGMAFTTVAALALNFQFYPALLPYQSTSALMHWAREQHIPSTQIACFNRHGHALDFYAGQILPELKTPDELWQFARQKGIVWVYTDEAGKNQLDQAAVPYKIAQSMGHFQVALLNTRFLNPKTRETALTPVYLLQISNF